MIGLAVSNGLLFGIAALVFIVAVLIWIFTRFR